MNFAFTAALSVLGSVVATLALLNALLGAGLSRLKASRGALGAKYYNGARTRFDRTELRFRTTVDVPVLDIHTVLQHRIPSTSTINKPFGKAEALLTVGGWSQSRLLASWAQLLRELLLEEVQFKLFHAKRTASLVTYVLRQPWPMMS